MATPKTNLGGKSLREAQQKHGTVQILVGHGGPPLRDLHPVVCSRHVDHLLRRQKRRRRIEVELEDRRGGDVNIRRVAGRARQSLQRIGGEGETVPDLQGQPQVHRRPQR